MYVVDDETFQQGRSVLCALAKELAGQDASGSRRPVDVRELIRRSADVGLAEGGEALYLQSIADNLERTFPIEELFTRKRRAVRG